MNGKKTDTKSVLQSGKQDGVKCPKCECRMSSVNYTRHAGDSTTRRRTCRHCGEVFTTVESGEAGK